jgi:hypothetical protein
MFAYVRVNSVKFAYGEIDELVESSPGSAWLCAFCSGFAH